MAPARLVFLNEPRYTEHEADKAFNEKRKVLSEELNNFIPNHPLFEGKEIEITFSHSGISSLVSILAVEQGKFVLKIPLQPEYSRNEANFLQAWERAGVSVPHVIETGEILGHPYVLMRYVDAPTLKSAHSAEELVGNKLYLQMGATLRKMHSAPSEGYGDPINGKAEYPDITTWLASPAFQDKVVHVKEHGLLNGAEESPLEEALEIISATVGANPATVYGHGDFSVGNVFATEPLTVFDPNPFLNHPYMDLARSIVLAVRSGYPETGAQLIAGYFGSEEYDAQLLRACLIVNAYQKVSYWHKTGRQEAIDNLRAYLRSLSGEHIREAI